MTPHETSLPDPPRVRPFSDWLREQAKGRSHDELSDGLRDLVARVTDTGKKGTLTYVVTVEQMKDGDALVVHDEIKLKLPEHDRAASIFYRDDDGNLVRSDPYRVHARLRYRINDGALVIGYTIERPEDVLRAAFLDVVDTIATASGRTVLRGTPA